MPETSAQPTCQSSNPQAGGDPLVFETDGQHALPFELIMPHTISDEGDGPLSQLLRQIRAASSPAERALLMFQWETLKFAGGYIPTMPALPVADAPVLPVSVPADQITEDAPVLAFPSAVSPAPEPPDAVRAVTAATGWDDFDLAKIINTQVAEQSYERIVSLQSPPQRTPNVEDLRATFAANKYFINEPNLMTVETSIQTGMPLIVEGPPGTGKTSLAEQITRAIGLDPKNPNHLIELFITPDIQKSSMLYEWNDSRRLMDMTALQAIAGHLPPAKLRQLYHDLAKESFSMRYLTIHRLLKAVLLPYRCVVLIDELDKGYGELDTMLFDILEKSSFVIPEIGRIGKPKPPQERPLFVITSNAQRELASPLKRRANYVYFHYLSEVVEAEVLVAKTGVLPAAAQLAASFFREMREHKTFRPAHLPSTAEALYTVKTLHEKGQDITRRNILRAHGLWLKGREDFEAFYRIFADEIRLAMTERAAA